MVQKKFEIVSIILILVLLLGVRLYKIQNPIGEWHSWRQADTAAVARHFVTDGITMMHPRYDDLSNIQSGKDNPSGWRMVEFPLYQAMAAVPARLIPQMSVEVWLRLVSILASAISCLCLILILKKLAGDLTGIFAGAYFAILPYSVFYGRAILPESLAVSFAMVSLFLLIYKKSWVFLLLAAVCAAMSLLVKPTAGFLLVPGTYVLIKNYNISIKGAIAAVIFCAITLVPFVLWRTWILQYPEGIPVYEWLLNAGNIRFKGAWFYWLFAERLGKLMLGYWGAGLLVLGAAALKMKKEGAFVSLWVLGGLAYLSIFAAGNVQHDYYQIILMPIIAALLGKGTSVLLDGRLFGRAQSVVALGLMLACILGFSFYTIRTYYWINRQDFIEAGKKADEILPKNAKVIASNNGDTTFLYYINRQGWPLGFDIDDKIKKGATHYVTISPTDADGETMALASRFTVLERNDTYAIIDLTRPKIAQ